MYCGKCGAEIADNVAFCPKCGKQVKRSSTEGTENRTRSNSTTPNKNLIIAGVIVALVLLTIISIKFISNRPHKLDLNQYLIIYALGTDGNGSLEIEFDNSKCEDDFLKVWKPAEDLAYNNEDDHYNKMFHAHRFVDMVWGFGKHFEDGAQDYRLRNGDKVTVTWNAFKNTNDDGLSMEDVILQNYNIIVEYEDIEYIVSGLEENDGSYVTPGFFQTQPNEEESSTSDSDEPPKDETKENSTLEDDQVNNPSEAKANYHKGKKYYDQKEYKSALQCFEQAAKQGNVEAQYSAGLMYYYGEGVEQDYQKAAEWLTKSAEQGDSDAQYNLGVLYFKGEGVEQDSQQAVEWYTKSAEQGNENAQYALGVKYLKGEGVEQDYQKAAEWFTKSYEQWNPDASYALGMMYFNGDGVEQDYEKAMKMFIRASQKGHEKANQMIEETEKKLN